jgi:hypothetical protein
MVSTGPGQRKDTVGRIPTRIFISQQAYSGYGRAFRERTSADRGSRDTSVLSRTGRPP